MQYQWGKLLSVIKVYLSVIITFFICTSGYFLANHFIYSESFINSIRILSWERYGLLAIGVLLFSILIYDKLCNQENDNKSTIPTFSGTENSSPILFATSSGCFIYYVTVDDTLANGWAVVVSSDSIVIIPLSLMTLLIASQHICEIESQKSDVEHVVAMALLCSVVISIIVLSCSLAADTLVHSQIAVPELMSNIANWLSIPTYTLFAASVVGHCMLSEQSSIQNNQDYAREAILYENYNSQFLYAKTANEATVKGIENHKGRESLSKSGKQGWDDIKKELAKQGQSSQINCNNNNYVRKRESLSKSGKQGWDDIKKELAKQGQSSQINCNNNNNLQVSSLLSDVMVRGSSQKSGVSQG